jgi:hypothetical protein
MSVAVVPVQVTLAPTLLGALQPCCSVPATVGTKMLGPPCGIVAPLGVVVLKVKMFGDGPAGDGPVFVQPPFTPPVMVHVPPVTVVQGWPPVITGEGNASNVNCPVVCARTLDWLKPK